MLLDFQCVLRYRQSFPNHYHALTVPQEKRPHNSAETNKASLQITTPSPLINDVIPSLSTKMLSTASEPVNSSATTYRSGSVFERHLENTENRWGRWAAPDLGFKAELGSNDSGYVFEKLAWQVWHTDRSPKLSKTKYQQTTTTKKKPINCSVRIPTGRMLSFNKPWRRIWARGYRAGGQSETRSPTFLQFRFGNGYFIKKAKLSPE